jgi:hypothetical protein
MAGMGGEIFQPTIPTPQRLSEHKDLSVGTEDRDGVECVVKLSRNTTAGAEQTKDRTGQKQGRKIYFHSPLLSAGLRCPLD